MKHQHKIIVKSATPPVVEFDHSVGAWYVRFSKKKIVKTLSEDKPGVVVAIDLDAQSEVVGVEMLGVKEFSIALLQSVAHIETPNIDLRKTRFVPVAHELARG